MDDRKLLELAAKAAGYTLWDGKYGALSIDMLKEWNPLSDDGDAFRLAVKLKLNIEVEERNNHAWSHIVWVPPCFEPLQGDPYASTRRAIVRAAAEIGKAL